MLLRPTAVAGLLAVYEGRIAEAEALLAQRCATGRRSAARRAGSRSLLCNLSWLEWWRGDFAGGSGVRGRGAPPRRAERQRTDARARGRAPQPGARRAGRRRRSARRSRRRTGRASRRTAFMQGSHGCSPSEGLLELSLGDVDAAERALAPLVALVEANGIREPMQAYYLPDAVEALDPVWASSTRARGVARVVCPPRPGARPSLGDRERGARAGACSRRRGAISTRRSPKPRMPSRVGRRSRCRSSSAVR